MPFALFAAVNAGLLPYQEPVQAVQPLALAAQYGAQPFAAQPLAAQPLAAQYAAVPQLPVPVQHAQLPVPVQHVPIQEQVYVQNVALPEPTRQVVSVVKTIVKEVQVCTRDKLV